MLILQLMPLQFCASIRGSLLHDAALVRFCHKCIDNNTQYVVLWKFKIMRLICVVRYVSGPQIRKAQRHFAASGASGGVCHLCWLNFLGMTSELRIVRGEFILRVEYDRRQRELAEAKKNGNLTEYLKFRKDKVQARRSVSGCDSFSEIDLYLGLFSMLTL